MLQWRLYSNEKPHIGDYAGFGVVSTDAYYTDPDYIYTYATGERCTWSDMNEKNEGTSQESSVIITDEVIEISTPEQTNGKFRHTEIIM